MIKKKKEEKRGEKKLKRLKSHPMVNRFTCALILTCDLYVHVDYRDTR